MLLGCVHKSWVVHAKPRGVVVNGKAARASLWPLTPLSPLMLPPSGVSVPRRWSSSDPDVPISSLTKEKFEEALKSKGMLADLAKKARNHSFLSDGVWKMVKEGVALLDQMEVAKGIQKLTEAMKADPFSPEIRCFLGYAQRLAGNTIEARRHFQKAINMKADFSDAHQGLGIIAMGEKDYYTARIHFFDALQCEPKNVSVMLHVAQSHLAENQLERAKGYFEKALQLDPKNVTVCASLGETYARMSDMRGARDYLQKATELDPNYGGALCSYCAVLVELNEFETALGCIKRVVEIMADPVKSKEQRGVPLQNRVKGLEEMWSSKLKYFWDSKNMRAAEEVANLISQISDIKEINMFSVTNKIKSHQLDDAESLLRRILKKDPNDKNAALMLAGVLKMKSEEGIKRY